MARLCSEAPEVAVVAVPPTIITEARAAVSFGVRMSFLLGWVQVWSTARRNAMSQGRQETASGGLDYTTAASWPRSTSARRSQCSSVGAWLSKRETPAAPPASACRAASAS